jgi:hypothetical protein
MLMGIMMNPISIEVVGLPLALIIVIKSVKIEKKDIPKIRILKGISAAVN